MTIRETLRKIKYWYKGKFGGGYLVKKSDSELFSLLRHEGHRIEKSHYNDIFDSNYIVYSDKRNVLLCIISILTDRNTDYQFDPSVVWAKDIVTNFDDFPSKFIEAKSSDDYTRDISYESLYQLMSNRRSCRIWADKQPNTNELEEIANKLVESAITAPNSGNRQGWRFKVILSEKEKSLFKGIKEKHTYNAPMLIFVGVDKRLFFAYGKSETSFYVDVGAAVQNMITAAQTTGLDSCWNHFSMELITSRKSNAVQYKKICDSLNIPDYIEPVAVLALGKAAFIPPIPSRMKVNEFLL
jgi:nitroreductase